MALVSLTFVKGFIKTFVIKPTIKKKKIKKKKDELLQLRDKATENDKVVAHIQEENQKLTDPLKSIIQQVKDLQRKLQTYSKVFFF